MAAKRRAILSVSDKSGIIEFAKELISLDFEIISTGGTKKALEEAGLAVISTFDVTGFPEIMDGRLKTLHPNIFGALLGVRDNPEHMAQLEQEDISLIDIVAVNLYPFKETISKPDVEWAEAIENIDIGGPSMLRAAAKNYQDVAVVTDPKDYAVIIDELKTSGDVSLETKKSLAAKVFRQTAAYDAYIAEYLTKEEGTAYPDLLTFTYEKVEDLRYGENPHQSASFYKQSLIKQGLPLAEQLHGKALSYNNIQDTNAAWQMVKEFKEQPVVVAVKHMNPCGIAVGNDLLEAFTKAYAADPVSIFGGIVATNQVIDVPTAELMKEIFLEVIIAPGFTDEAFAILSAKKNLRLLTLKDEQKYSGIPQVVSVLGGLLLQDEDERELTDDDLTVVTKKQPTAEELEQLKFAWKVVKHVKSNAIVLARDNMTIGIGAGQMNRVGSAGIAIAQAGDKAAGSVMASDAFFPMNDTVLLAAEAGITAIIQTGGSIRDEESIIAADEKGIAMVMTGIRHFKH